MSIEKISLKIDSYAGEVVALQKALVAIPALSPTYNPPLEHIGELKKVKFLESYLKQKGITDLTRVDAPDDRVPGGVRPNLIARIKGKDNSRTVWVMAHTDIVPPGDLSKWSADPYVLQVDGDKIVGRGVEDNHQGVVMGVMAAMAFVETQIKPKYDLAILFVADEECGSKYGIEHVLKVSNPFKNEDFIIVPDGGIGDGSEIEVAEKGIAWMKFTVSGIQTHASTPAKGKNAMRAGAHLIVALDELLKIFDKKNSVFDPPTCTFEPTKKEPNVPNINTIPGEDIFYLDCRIIPDYSLDQVEEAITSIVDKVAKEYGVKIKSEYEQRSDAAPATPVNAPVIAALSNAVKKVYDVDAKTIGIGGGTVAAHLRRQGLPCVVWSKIDDTAHSLDESASISNILGDAKVIAYLAMGE